MITETPLQKTLKEIEKKLDKSKKKSIKFHDNDLFILDEIEDIEENNW